MLLHGLMRLRLGPIGPMGPRLASLLSSAAFGLAHIGNEEVRVVVCKYVSTHLRT